MKSQDKYQGYLQYGLKKNAYQNAFSQTKKNPPHTHCSHLHIHQQPQHPSATQRQRQHNNLFCKPFIFSKTQLEQITIPLLQKEPHEGLMIRDQFLQKIFHEKQIMKGGRRVSEVKGFKKEEEDLVDNIHLFISKVKRKEKQEKGEEVKEEDKYSSPPPHIPSIRPSLLQRVKQRKASKVSLDGVMKKMGMSNRQCFSKTMRFFKSFSTSFKQPKRVETHLVNQTKVSLKVNRAHFSTKNPAMTFYN